MRAFVAFLALSACGLVLAETPAAVRNPFWPIGYQGESTPISAEARVKPAPPKAAQDAKPEKEISAKNAAAEAAVAKAKAEADAKEKAAKAEAEAKAAKEKSEREAALRKIITDGDWEKAGRSLKISMPVVFTDLNGGRCSSVKINGNIYADGDYISSTCDNTRFTWRVQGLDAGRTSLKLSRVRAYRIPEELKDGGKK